MAWNFGDILDTIIPVLPEGHLALVHGEREITWQEMDKRSNNLGRYMLENGAATGERSAFAQSHDIWKHWRHVSPA